MSAAASTLGRWSEERATLRAWFADPSLICEGWVDVALVFHGDDHGWIGSAMASLKATGERITPFTVLEYLIAIDRERFGTPHFAALVVGIARGL